MSKSITTALIAVVSACSNVADNSVLDHSDERLRFKGWVLSRCLSLATVDEGFKQDANNSASAYLEQSKIPVEKLVDIEILIHATLAVHETGSIPGTFNVKKCIELYNSPKLEAAYLSVTQ